MPGGIADQVDHDLLETNRRILTIDDHSETLELMRDIFLEERDEVIALSSISPDLSEIPNADPDLAIIDPRLSSKESQLSGWDVVRLVKARADLKDLRILVISADAESLEQHVREAAQMDGVQLLSKPFSLEHLLAMVGDAMRHGTHLKPWTGSDAAPPAEADRSG